MSTLSAGLERRCALLDHGLVAVAVAVNAHAHDHDNGHDNGHENVGHRD